MHWLMIASLFFFLKTETRLLEDELPPYMEECLNMFGNYAVTQQASVYKFCWNFFDWQNTSNYTNLIGPEVYNYIERLLRPFYGMQPPDVALSIRKEYRRLTDREREDFHTAVRMLKYDKTVPPNKYDAIALLHSNGVSPGAHSGPNFPGWHRIYLVLFERAIKEMIPDAILPFWDSTLESNMEIPELSVIFSDHFAGNGNGYVNSGPFRDFEGIKNGRLYRNLGNSGGGPISATYAGNILSQMRTKQITYPTANLGNSLEQAHNEVHTWVGGQMSKIDTSADDPLFFVHHCFIDYLWSLFRMKQKENRIDSEFDYPEGATGEHHPLTIMKPFQYFRNIHGYSDYWTDYVYSYKVSPYCSPDEPTCKSKWLTCDTERWRCVSAHQPFQSNIERWILNDFVINGIKNKELWCYITVEVYYGTFSDPLETTYFESNVLQSYGSLNSYQSNKNSDCIQKDKNKIDIYVESDGISYRGRYLDFVVLDKNTPSATIKFKIAMANIDNSTSYITAYDSCGQVCSPFCLVYNSNPPEYKPCSGVVMNRSGPPFYCSIDIQKDYQKNLYSEFKDDTYTFIKFYCDNLGTLRNIPGQNSAINIKLHQQEYQI